MPSRRSPALGSFQPPEPQRCRGGERGSPSAPRRVPPGEGAHRDLRFPDQALSAGGVLAPQSPSSAPQEDPGSAASRRRLLGRGPGQADAAQLFPSHRAQCSQGSKASPVARGFSPRLPWGSFPCVGSCPGAGAGPLPAARSAQSREARKGQHWLRMLQECALPALLLAFTDPVTSRTILQMCFFSLCTYLMFFIRVLFCKRPEERARNSKTQAPCFHFSPV